MLPRSNGEDSPFPANGFIRLMLQPPQANGLFPNTGRALSCLNVILLVSDVLRGTGAADRRCSLEEDMIRTASLRKRAGQD